MCFKVTCVFDSISVSLNPEILDNFHYYKKQSFFLNVTFEAKFCTGDLSDKYHSCYDRNWSPWTF
jgi:hypothetical protein